MAHSTDHLMPARHDVAAAAASRIGSNGTHAAVPLRAEPPRPATAGAPVAVPWGSILCALGLSPGDAAALERSARTRVVALGQPVFSQKDDARSVMLLVQGTVWLGAAGTDGGFRPERALHGPAWLDASSAWLNGTHALDAQAVTAATVAEWPRDVLGPLLEQRPTLARRLITTLAREVHDLTLNTHDLMHKDAPARLAAWLNQRCAEAPGMPGHGIVHLSERKRDIASQLAITPETLSRLMRSFMRQGVIDVAGYTVHVIDRAALARLASGADVASTTDTAETV